MPEPFGALWPPRALVAGRRTGGGLSGMGRAVGSAVAVVVVLVAAAATVRRRRT
jgi:hypothetical protein